MDEASELANYLPISFKTPKEQEYIGFRPREPHDSEQRGNEASARKHAANSEGQIRSD
jgi:hypothetical protein